MTKALEYALLAGGILLSIITAVVIGLLWMSDTPNSPSNLSGSNFLILFLIVGAIAFVVGAILIIAYFTSKNVFFLAVGFILTLVIPGICLFLGYKKWSEAQVMCYVMVPIETSAPKESEELQTYRKTALNNCKKSLPADVIEDIENAKN